MLSVAYTSRILVFCLFIVIIWGMISCVTKVYPDERLEIDPAFLRLFNSISQKDTISFRNSAGDGKLFIISRIDSTTRNKKGWFINEEPFKLVEMFFRETGADPTRLERINQIFVNKDPGTNANSLCIQMDNFYWHENFLPNLSTDTASLNGIKITGYYFFQTSLPVKNGDDIQELYISPKKGIIAFRTLSKELWVSESNAR